jgi:zinc transport system substrate-binding protein
MSDEVHVSPRVSPQTGLLFFALSLLIVFLAAGTPACCANEPGPADDGILDVTVSIPPQQYFVERVGGERVHVNVMVEPGADPHTYEPKPEQMRALSRSVAYFSIGVEFEAAWLDKFAATNPGLRIVDTIADIERMPMEEGAEEHAGGEPDPHVWLSPRLVKVQSQAIYAALAELDPEHETEYKANLEAFVADIDTLEADIREALTGLDSRKFMVFHPAWGYFARDFGLEQIPVEVGGQEPSAQELAHLIAMAREENIRVIFAQPEFSTQDAETIAREIGGEVLLISPLAPDWLDNMRRVARAFADVLNE